MSKRVILVVEDEPFIRSIAAEMLQDAGCEAIDFETADAASTYDSSRRVAQGGVGDLPIGTEQVRIAELLYDVENLARQCAGSCP